MMLNYIWFALMAIALIVAIATGTPAQVTKAAVDSAKTAVDISLGLVGIMTLWLGIMRIAEKAGLISLLGRALRPISRLIFPDVPPEHPAIGAVIMNFTANLLGLSNAATPLGIKAMEELQELNPNKETAADPGDDHRRPRGGWREEPDGDHLHGIDRVGVRHHSSRYYSEASTTVLSDGGQRPSAVRTAGAAVLH